VDAAAVDPLLEDLWARAQDGEADDLARLHDREGSLALVERGQAAGFRLRAIEALGYADDLYAFPWLSDVAVHGGDTEALLALASLAQVAARPRRSVDPEDGLEVRQGCDALLGLAKDVTGPRARRIGAVRVLRMLEDRGCAQRSDIPTDVDLR
jgi:hypothetical protein